MKNVIILPTYNEAGNIKNIISEIFKHAPDAYILVADDDSPDGTSRLVEELRSIYPQLRLLKRKQKEGLGKAYVHAFQKTLEDPDVETVIMMDADLSHPASALPIMLKERKKYDIVIGSRYVTNGNTEGWELWRRILSYGGNFYARTVTRMPISDCTAGFNAINANYLRRTDFSKLGMSGYAFIMELKYMLWKEGATFHEIPITFRNRAEGESKISRHIISEGVLAPWRLVFKQKKQRSF